MTLRSSFSHLLAPSIRQVLEQTYFPKPRKGNWRRFVCYLIGHNRGETLEPHAYACYRCLAVWYE